MRRIAQILILLILAILIIPIFLPKKITATAEKEISKPVEVVFEEFTNLNEYSKWNPWTSQDSLAKIEISMPYRGEGAGFKWSTENLEGDMIISKANPNSKIQYELTGFELGGNSIMTAEFQPQNENKTKVKWQIESEEMGYFNRYFIYFKSKSLSEKLMEGLNNLESFLKDIVLTEAQAGDLKAGEIRIVKFEGLKLITVQNDTSLESDEMTTATEESFGLLFSYLTDYLKVPQSQIGYPVSYYTLVDSIGNRAKFRCGYPITESVQTGEGMELMSLPATETLVALHKGSYKSLHLTMGKMKNYASQNKLNLTTNYWEEYLNDPEVIKNENELLTKIYIPIKK